MINIPESGSSNKHLPSNKNNNDSSQKWFHYGFDNTKR